MLILFYRLHATLQIIYGRSCPVILRFCYSRLFFFPVYNFHADGVLGAAIAGAGMVVVGGTVLAVAGAAALVGILTKKK